MKKSIFFSILLLTLTCLGGAFADERTDSAHQEKKQPLSSQVIDSGKEAKAETPKDEQTSEPKRPFHYVGRSENG